MPRRSVTARDKFKYRLTLQDAEIVSLLEQSPFQQFSLRIKSAMTESRGWCQSQPSDPAIIQEMSIMRFHLAILAVVAAALAACTTASVPSNPLEQRWNGKSAGVFIAAYGPPVADRAGSGGATVYTWRGGFVGGKSCTVELTADKTYTITAIRAVTDRVDPKGGPSHCEKTLDAV